MLGLRDVLVCVGLVGLGWYVFRDVSDSFLFLGFLVIFFWDLIFYREVILVVRDFWIYIF